MKTKNITLTLLDIESIQTIGHNHKLLCTHVSRQCCSVYTNQIEYQELFNMPWLYDFMDNCLHKDLKMNESY